MFRYLSAFFIWLVFSTPIGASHIFLEQLKEPNYTEIEKIDIQWWHPETVRWIKTSLINEYPESALEVDWLEITSGEKISSNHTQYERLNVLCTFRNHMGPHGYDVQEVHIWVMENSVITGYFPSMPVSPL